MENTDFAVVNTPRRDTPKQGLYRQTMRVFYTNNPRFPS